MLTDAGLGIGELAIMNVQFIILYHLLQSWTNTLIDKKSRSHHDNCMTNKASTPSVRERISNMTLPDGIRELSMYYNTLSKYMKLGLPLRSEDYIFMHALNDLHRAYEEIAIPRMFGADEIDLKHILLSDIPSKKEFDDVRAFIPGYYALHEFLNQLNT